MKNVLIVSHGMEIGGAESALLGLLSAFDYSRYSVDLFLIHRSGELMKYIPKEVNILPENKKYASLAVPLSAVLKNGTYGVALGRFIGNRKAVKFSNAHNLKDNSYIFIDYSHKYTSRFMPMISEKEYDLAISFLTPHYFVYEKTNAKKKIAWIHTDYSSIELNTESELAIWEKYDKIIAISEKVAEAFLKTFPTLSGKVEIIENIHPSKLIKSQAEQVDVSGEMPDDGYTKILSVGRYCHAKNFDNVPDICRRMENVKWYIIGYGSDEELIKRKIKESCMENRVILLGKKANPYPYFKACDIYVQPSRYEGNSVTVNEALIMGKLVAIADYPTASSQIRDGVDGIIIPQGNEECAEALMKFIEDKALQSKLLNKVCTSDYSKSEEINKIYKIIDG